MTLQSSRLDDGRWPAFTSPVVGFAIVALAAVFIARPAHACSCVGQTDEEYLARAQRVFLVRADAADALEKGFRQRVTVLFTLKGAASKQYIIDRPDGGTMCDRTLASGEVALLFVRDGQARICDGNYAMSVQFPRLEATLAAAQVPKGKLGLAALRLAVEKASSDALSKSKTATVFFPALAPATFEVGNTHVSIVRVAKPDSLQIERGLSFGRYHLVTVRTPGRESRFEAIIGMSGKQATILWFSE